VDVNDLKQKRLIAVNCSLVFKLRLVRGTVTRFEFLSLAYVQCYRGHA
jgi:hypothetical protein